MALERADLEFYANSIKEDVKRVETSVNMRLDSILQQTQKNEVEIAVLKATQEDSGRSARNQGASWGGTLGAIVAGVVAYLYQALTGHPLGK